VPFAAFQVTAVFVVEPWTVAVNEMVLLTTAAGDAGEITTPVTAGAVAAAVPWSGTTTGLALALVIKLNVPLTVPAADGPNVTSNFWL